MAKKPKLHRYKYTISNPVTGLNNFSGVVEAKDKEAATARAEHIARCFGKSTKLLNLVKLRDGEE